MFKYLLLCSFFILNVHGHDLKFNECDKDGWKCRNTTQGCLDVIFSCTEEFQKNYTDVKWSYENLPPKTKSVTIENCKIKLTLKTNLYSSGALKSIKKENITETLSNYLVHFNSIIVRNVTELILEQRLRDLFSRLRGNASVHFENIELIKRFPSYMIEGPSRYIQKMKMESFHYVLKNIKIQQMDYRTVFWDKKDIPIHMMWKNLRIDAGEQPVEIIATTSDWPESEIEQPQDNQVCITDSIITKISYKFLSMQNTYFDFKNNSVDVFEPFGIESKTLYQNISGNTINLLKSDAFSWIYYGKEENNLIFHSNKINNSQSKALFFTDLNRNLSYDQRVSFQDNKFNCSNSEWMKRSSNRTANARYFKLNESDYKFLTDTEDIFYNNRDNICIEFNCPVTINQYREFFLQNGKVPTRCKPTLY